MDPITFPEVSVVIAKDQPEYRPLPAAVNPTTPARVVTFCWKLTWQERFKLLVCGKLWHQVFTFGNPLQPQLLLVNKPTHEELTGRSPADKVP